MTTFEIVSAEWTLDPSNSRVYPIANLKQVYNHGDLSINRVALRDATFSQLKKLASGKRIKVDGSHFIAETFTNINFCPKCKGKLDTEQGLLICPTDLCSGKPFVALNNLLSSCRIFEDLETKEIKNYLTIFPVGKENFTNVLNVVDKTHGLITYLTLFKQSPKKDTSARADLLVQTFGKYLGEQFWSMECELERKFAQGLPNDLFWWMLNLPYISDVVAAEKLANLDPFKFLQAYEDTNEAKRILDKCNLLVQEKMSIIMEKNYWGQVLSILKSISKNLNVT